MNEMNVEEVVKKIRKRGQREGLIKERDRGSPFSFKKRCLHGGYTCSSLIFCNFSIWEECGIWIQNVLINYMAKLTLIVKVI